MHSQLARKRARQQCPALANEFEHLLLSEYFLKKNSLIASI
jgi:hypothetical protein